MKQTFKEIKAQLTPNNRTVTELIDRINGNETPAVKTAGLRWAVALPVVAALGIAILGGMISVSDKDVLEIEPVSSSSSATDSVVSETRKEFGYPAAQVETKVEAADGIFDFKNGGYYSMEKHQPKDPPDEETKLRLLKQNLNITVINGDDGLIVDDNAPPEDVEFTDNNGHQWVDDPDTTPYNTYTAVDDTFAEPHHVIQISHYLCMGKVKDGDRIYELLVGYFGGYSGSALGVSFGDGKYYMYDIRDYELKYTYANIHMTVGENWKEAAMYNYDVVTGKKDGDPVYYNDNQNLDEQRINAVIDALNRGEGSVSLQNDDAVDYDSGGRFHDGSENYCYKFSGFGKREDFNDDDIYGFGDISANVFAFSVCECFSMVLNTPDSDGSITALLPNGFVMKFRPMTDEEAAEFEDYRRMNVYSFDAP